MRLTGSHFLDLLIFGVLAFTIGSTTTLYLLLKESDGKCPEMFPPNYAELLRSSPKNPRNTLDGSGHFLAVLILSAPGNVVLREAARKTWLSECHQNRTLGCYFVIAADGLAPVEKNRLVEEGQRYGDVLLAHSITDHYRNLTAKLLHSLVWLGYSHSVNYLLKVDDDSFARLGRIREELSRDHASEPESGLYWGYFDGRARPRKSGKWAEPNWVLCDRYLPYALGGGYVLGGRLVKYIAANSNYLQLYASEDVSVGTWLGPLGIVRRRHDPRFDTEYRSRGCSDTYLVTHKRTAEDMYAMWTELTEGTGKLCPGGHDNVEHPAYSYDWAAPPSRCCLRPA